MVAFVLRFRIISAFMIILWYILKPILSILHPKKKKLIPRTNDELFKKSAVEIAIFIRRRSKSCHEVVSKFIERIKEVNPILNAVVEDRFDEALKDAKEVDDFLKNTKLSEEELLKTKPLLGVPVTIKQNLSLKGLSLSVGSLKRLGIRAEEDGVCVSRLKEAGAIPLCITNTPEYCLSIESTNFITGTTNNPYNTLNVSGGSSGGEGALIGAGASVCGLASDIAGSIRIPSCFNGVFGHKPSPEIIPLKGHYPLSTDPKFNYHLTIGPMVRYAEDLPLMTKILAGENASKLNLDENVNLRKLKIFFMEDAGTNFGVLEVQEEIKKAIRNCVAHLKNEWECEISNVKFKEFEFSPEFGTKAHFGLTGAPDVFENENLMGEFFKMFVGKAKHPFNIILYGMAKRNRDLIPGTTEENYAELEKLKEKVVDTLGRNGVFFYPAFPSSAVPHYGSTYASIGAMYPMISNILGLPSTTFPVGFDKQGLPIGIQVMAAPNQDRLCFAVAKEMETLFGGWKPPY